MMLLARRGTLALAAVVDIALHARRDPVAAKALAGRLDLPPRHLEPLLQALVRGGILRGLRGPKGGYELARERRRISVADVLRAILAEPETNERMPPLVEHVVLPVMTDMSAHTLRAFEGVSIDDLCAKAIRQVDGFGESQADFAI